MAPYCSICSYMQPTGSKKRVYHRHFSAREVRHTQGVDFTPEYYGRNYMCPTCMLIHSTRPDKGLNVCLGDSLLHEVHRPLNPSVTCPADPFHIDWVTISGGTITDLTDAFIHDYKNQVRPMRVFVSAGLNDLIRGADKDLVIGRFIRLSEVINEQNCCHPPVKNELVIATLLTPPKLVWFEDNGTPPPNHKNHYQVIKDINSWISFFNHQNGRVFTPRFNRFGVRCGKRWDSQAGKLVSYQQHQLNQWRESEPIEDKLHLNDQWRVRMAGAVVRHFRGEVDRFGILG